tara:strand:+ start:625 stop:822 length:198 start_codon:yes stop_codon:yes gene_type:complete
MNRRLIIEKKVEEIERLEGVVECLTKKLHKEELESQKWRLRYEAEEHLVDVYKDEVERLREIKPI